MNKIPIILLLFCTASFGAAIIAENCSKDSVQAACNRASDGDTVKVPAGTAKYTNSGVSLLNRRLVIFGAAAYSNDSTIIIDSTSSTYGTNPFFLNSGNSTSRYVVAGFSFHGTLSGSSGCVLINNYSSTMSSLSRNNIVCNCKFYNQDAGVNFSGNVYGLIHHCTFTITKSNAGVLMSTQVIGLNDSAWIRPYSLGDSNATFIEDCTFYGNLGNGGDAIDCYQGAHVVFRHNNVHNTYLDFHGRCGTLRSTMSYEVYNNTIADSAAFSRSVDVRGGSGVFYNNTITGNYGQLITITDYRTCAGYGSSCPNRCDGTYPSDGNTSGMLGWPCQDQIGRGANQISKPLYQWNNTYNGGLVLCSVGSNDSSICKNPSEADHIKVGRDYFDTTAMPGYTSYQYPHPYNNEGPTAVLPVSNHKTTLHAIVRLRGAGFAIAFPAAIRSPELTIVDLSGRGVYHTMLTVASKTADAEGLVVYNSAWKKAPARTYFAVVKESTGNERSVLGCKKFVVDK